MNIPTVPFQPTPWGHPAYRTWPFWSSLQHSECAVRPSKYLSLSGSNVFHHESAYWDRLGHNELERKRKKKSREQWATALGKNNKAARTQRGKEKGLAWFVWLVCWLVSGDKASLCRPDWPQLDPSASHMSLTLGLQYRLLALKRTCVVVHGVCRLRAYMRLKLQV